MFDVGDIFWLEHLFSDSLTYLCFPLIYRGCLWVCMSTLHILVPGVNRDSDTYQSKIIAHISTSWMTGGVRWWRCTEIVAPKHLCVKYFHVVFFVTLVTIEKIRIIISSRAIVVMMRRCIRPVGRKASRTNAINSAR